MKIGVLNVSGDYLEELKKLIDEDTPHNKPLPLPTSLEMWYIIQDVLITLRDNGEIDSFHNHHRLYRVYSNRGLGANIEFTVKVMKIFKVRASITLFMSERGELNPIDIFRQYTKHVRTCIDTNIGKRSLYSLWKENKLV